MYGMFKKVNAKEAVVGWYSTGPTIRPADLEINELWRRYTPNPVMVIINVAPTEIGGLRFYFPLAIKFKFCAT